MEDVHDVVGLETFTKKEILKKVNKMENTQFHGKGTDMVKAIQHGKKILEVRALSFLWYKLNTLIGLQ